MISGRTIALVRYVRVAAGVPARSASLSANERIGGALTGPCSQSSSDELVQVTVTALLVVYPRYRESCDYPLKRLLVPFTRGVVSISCNINGGSHMG